MLFASLRLCESIIFHAEAQRNSEIIAPFCCRYNLGVFALVTFFRAKKLKESYIPFFKKEPSSYLKTKKPFR
jgi:hypothetical protein